MLSDAKFVLVMAKELMWIAITSILATFDIHSPVDKDGVPLKPTVDYGPIGNLKYVSATFSLEALLKKTFVPFLAIHLILNARSCLARLKPNHWSKTL